MIRATDYLGHEIKVGDLVLYPRLRYRDFYKAYVMKITPCMVFLSSDNTGTYPGDWIKQTHNQVIKI